MSALCVCVCVFTSCVYLPQGDKLYGRGTTDCLGHVALITDLFLQLAEKKPKLKFKVIAIFIAAWVMPVRCWGVSASVLHAGRRALLSLAWESTKWWSREGWSTSKAPYTG